MYLATTDATEGAEEHRWWVVNFESKTILVVTRVAPVSRYVDGNAKAADRHADHFATPHSTITLPATAREAGAQRKRSVAPWTQDGGRGDPLAIKDK